MTTRATGTYELKSWDEKTWDGKPSKDVSGAKLTHAHVTQSFHGDIEGEATIQFLMTYRDDGSASYVGLLHMDGRIGDRSGTFVLQADGTFEGNAAKINFTVVPNSGTGDLHGLRGKGGSVALHGQSQNPFTLDYDID